MIAMRALLFGCVTMLAAPLTFSGQSAGETDFLTLCSPCHGKSGKGDGPNAAQLRRKPIDLTTIAKRNGGVFPEEQVFQTISGLDEMDAHGTRAMPVWGDIFVEQAVGSSVSLADALKASDTATLRIVGLLRYIETMQEKP
jgi:mono/diheme cytochrome c family protein